MNSKKERCSGRLPHVPIVRYAEPRTQHATEERNQLGVLGNVFVNPLVSANTMSTFHARILDQ